MAFRLTWHESILERAMRERPALAQFQSGSHEHLLSKFRDLDTLTFAYNQATLARRHWDGLPRMDGGGQLGVLSREMVKSRKHLPIRQLIGKAGNAIQAIKPVFMMSPMSVAKFLAPGSVSFDLVIFDEASQVKPVDALGALLRGRQAVVVGDTQQMPPTSFFDTLLDNDDSNDENTTADIESILGLFSAQGAPERMLRWHYRSRHESLIAVSNQEFYDNRLVVFPSPDRDRTESGLRYHHLPNTAYDRGGSRTNKGEAEAVAKAIMEHARTQPNASLGVVAFSTAQADEIQQQLELLRRQDASCETFFQASGAEPFFVKNLEMVQGDEREVIFISVGYGRSGDGKLTMNFGPLNKAGGHRRLNVLISRARLRCEVFTNLTADDIADSETRGVRCLKIFLAYAATGQLALPYLTGKEMDSPFEEAVFKALVDHGYQVEPQVGSAGFYIDLAVRDPERPGRYLLGIECDGASYHSSRSARDRDRLRQQVLENLGWQIYRIWSTDWFRRPDAELKRLIEAIEAAKETANTRRFAPIVVPEPVAIERESVKPIDATSHVGGSEEVYQVAAPQVDTGGLDLHLVSPEPMASWVAQVVEVESPVHVTEIGRRIIEAAGVKKLGGRIQTAIAAGCDAAVRHGLVRKKGDFLWHPTMTEPIVRDRSQLPASARKIELIAPEELAVAIRKVVKGSFGIEKGQVGPLACRLFGFARTSADMVSQVDAIVDRMLGAGELTMQNGCLVLP